MRVAKTVKKLCPACAKEQLVAYGKEGPDMLLRCSVCQQELRREDATKVWERLVQVVMSEDDED